MINTKMPQVAKELLLKITNCFQQQRFTLFKFITPTELLKIQTPTVLFPPNRLYPKQRHLNLLTLNCHLTFLLLLCPDSPS